MGGTKKFKKNKNTGTVWEIGSKRRVGFYNSMGMNATTLRNRTSRAEHNAPITICELCGTTQATWRGKVVCLCDKCYKELKSVIGI